MFLLSSLLKLKVVCVIKRNMLNKVYMYFQEFKFSVKLLLKTLNKGLRHNSF